jgi:hypothetical protein
VPADVVADLYQAHGLALVRTALMLVGDKPTAEDVVQDAFIARARQRAFGRPVHHATAVWSAESAAMAREESRLTMQAVSRLPARAPGGARAALLP